MKTVLLFLLMTTFTPAQKSDTLSRSYSDGLTHLTIKSDSTFTISQPDPVFTDCAVRFESTGTWQGKGKDIVLNPHLEKRRPAVTFTEKYLPDADSVTVKINYLVTTCKNEQPTDTVPASLQRYTLYLNQKGNYLNLVDGKIEYPRCLFGGKMRNVRAIDSIATARFERTDKVTKIGLKTYGFDDYIELIPKDSGSNYFEIMIVQPVDYDRRPRSKMVRVNKGEAYYYQRSGRFNRLAPLYRDRSSE